MFNLKKINKIIWFFLISIIFLIFCLTFPYDLFMFAKDGVTLTKSELNNIVSKNQFLSTQGIVKASSFDEIEEYAIKYNLFNMFNVTSLRVKVENQDQVYLGGDCLGITLKSKGLLVIGSNYVLTADGVKNPLSDSDLKVGDIILAINDTQITDVTDIEKSLKNCNGNAVEVLIKRENEVIVGKITPALDKQSKTYKLGLWVKNDASGVGTLTYIKPDDLRFGALGHSINKNSTDEILEISGGNIYNCNVIGVREGQRGMAGELLGLFSQTNPQGVIDKNIRYGIFGNVFENSDLANNGQLIEIGGKASAKPGKAQIVSTISGNQPEYFDIELIKVNYQSSANEKSMVFRVTDQDLISKTGGIVQGMSGSPIIQNGKIIGAVTHVFVNDPTKGFGVYIDWMINE